MTGTVTSALAALGVVGMALAATGIAVGGAAAIGLTAPLRAVRGFLWGYELWVVFFIAAVSTGGSLFFSEVAHYVPCELCWYERICLFPLALITLLAAIASDFRIARYLLPLPVVGTGVAIYHLLIERGVVGEGSTCRLSAPGGCATRWINEFGFVTIPTLALTSFALLFLSLALAATGIARVPTLAARA